MELVDNFSELVIFAATLMAPLAEREIGLTVSEFLGILVLFLSPVLTWIIARRKEERDSLLADIEAVRGWAEERRGFEDDQRRSRDLISNLYTQVDLYREELKWAHRRIDELEEQLRKCVEVPTDDL